ncbi:MAG: GNAT family N-acetyltransferase [Fimbriimonadales bacterium]
MASNVVVRRYQESDREAFGRVRSFTYRGGEPVRPDENLFRDDSVGYVAEVDGNVVAAFTALRMTCNIDGTHLPCAGVAAVAVNPEFRKGGVGSSLMQEGLRLMKEDGFVLASLYPFRETYYRRFGYETCGTRFRLSVPAHRLPATGSELPVRRIEPEAWDQVRACYERFAVRYNGMNLRTSDMWWRTGGGDTPFAVYAAGDPVEAYAMLRLVPDFWEAQEIKELVATTPRGYAAILGFLNGLCINKDRAEWHEAGDSPYLAHYLDQGVRITNERLVMYRVLDVPKALSARRPVGSGSFAFSVEDPILAENNGVWRAEWVGGAVAVAHGKGPIISLGIRSFNQVLLGQPSYADLARHGSVPENAIAEALFPARPVYCADFF